VYKVADRIRLVSTVFFIFSEVVEDLFQSLLQISALHELVAVLGGPLQRIRTVTAGQPQQPSFLLGGERGTSHTMDS
jgi:hypothetical protein